MKQNRKQLSEQDIGEVMNQLSRTGKYSDELLKLVKGDLEYGLSKEEVDIYLTKKMPFEAKQKLSEAMREGVPSELTALLAEEGMNIHQMETAIGFHKEGTDFELIKMVVEQKLNAHGMKELYKKIREKTEPAVAEKKPADVTVNKELEELYRKLSDRDELISSQQDNINQVNSALLKLKQEKEQTDEDKRKLQESVESLKRQLEEKERQLQKTEEAAGEQTPEEEPKVEVAEQSEPVETTFPGAVKLTDETGKSVYGIPIQYVITGTSAESKEQVVVEKTTKKRTGVWELIAKLLFKKKSHRDIVRLVASGNLSTEQLVQIRVGMEKHLTEAQLLSLINNDVPADRMKEIIEIAVLENGM